MSTTNIAKVLKLAAMTTTRRPGSSPVSSSRTISPWGMRSTWRFCWARSLKPWRTFQQEQRRTCSDHPNVESHVVRLVGDTDHWTKLEAGAKKCRTGTGSRHGDSWRPNTRRKHRVGVRDAASRATAWDERPSGKV